jgi:hypothetical protein
LVGDSSLASNFSYARHFIMMTVLAMTAMLIGALLGQRFKVLILIPAMAIASAAVFALGVAHNNNLWSVLLVAALTVTALQLGYLGGTAIRFAIAGARIDRHSPGTIAVVQRSAR